MLECAQNLACVGAEPLGADQLPQLRQPREAGGAPGSSTAPVSGLAEACEALGVPVVGGNVSLYNEGPEGPIYPTPVIGMVGELPDPAQVAGSSFAAEGDAIALLGPFAPVARRLRAGEAARRARDRPARARHRRRGRGLRDSSATRFAAGRIASAHDISDGGLACALAECAIGGRVGCRVDLAPLRERGCSPEEALFGEGTGGFLVTGSRAELKSFAHSSVAVALIGETGGKEISISAGDADLTLTVQDATRTWSSLAERIG